MMIAALMACGRLSDFSVMLEAFLRRCIYPVFAVHQILC
jgi:hypothetical protein